MGSPASTFLGEIGLARWLGPALRASSPAVEAAPAGPPLPDAGLNTLAAVGFLSRLPRPNRGFACPLHFDLAACPFRAEYEQQGDGSVHEARVLLALSAGRALKGGAVHGKVEAGLRSRLLGADRAAAAPELLAVLLHAVCGDLEAARGLYKAIAGRAAQKWDLAFFPGDSGRGGSAAASAVLAYATAASDPSAVELARRLARGVMSGVPEAGGWIREDGSFTGETLPAAQDAWAAAEVAGALGDREMLLWAERVFSFIRRTGTDTGFFPRALPLAAPAEGDTATSAAMAGLACCLARAGLAEHYDDAERYLANHIRMAQLTPGPAFGEWYRRLHAGRPREAVEAALTAVIQEAPGAIVANASPTALLPAQGGAPRLLASAAAAAGAVRAAAAAFHACIREADGTVDVALLIPRETEWVKLIPAEPREGKLSIAVKRGCSLRVRVPSWTDRGGVTAQRSGSPARFNFDESGLCMAGLRAGETVVVRWPVPVFTQKIVLPVPGAPAALMWSWEGARARAVEAAGTGPGA
jgi:hypothetical protein